MNIKYANEVADKATSQVGELVLPLFLVYSCFFFSSLERLIVPLMFVMQAYTGKQIFLYVEISSWFLHKARTWYIFNQIAPNEGRTLQFIRDYKWQFMTCI